MTSMMSSCAVVIAGRRGCALIGAGALPTRQRLIVGVRAGVSGQRSLGAGVSSGTRPAGPGAVNQLSWRLLCAIEKRCFFRGVSSSSAANADGSGRGAAKSCFGRCCCCWTVGGGVSAAAASGVGGVSAASPSVSKAARSGSGIAAILKKNNFFPFLAFVGASDRFVFSRAFFFRKKDLRILPGFQKKKQREKTMAAAAAAGGEKPLKVILLGDSAVGKSKLMERFLSGE